MKLTKSFPVRAALKASSHLSPPMRVPSSLMSLLSLSPSQLRYLRSKWEENTNPPSRKLQVTAASHGQLMINTPVYLLRHQRARARVCGEERAAGAHPPSSSLLSLIPCSKIGHSETLHMNTIVDFTFLDLFHS